MLKALLGNSKSRLDSYINTCMLHSNKYLFSYSSHLMKTCCTYTNDVGHTRPAAATVRSLLSEHMVYIH
jgi:hypothetical protein